MCNIRYTQRPRLAHEHPNGADYWRYFKQNILTLRFRKPRFTQVEKRLAQLAGRNYFFTKANFDTLVEYFIRSFLHHSGANYAYAYFRGLPSEQGVRSDCIEGAARNWVLIAAFVRHQVQQNERTDKNELIEQARKALSQGFLAATDPESIGFWGTLSDYSQVICETADFALALWLSKNEVWCHYSSAQQKQILCWLEQVHQVRTVDNNWHLFIVMTQLIIEDLSGKKCVNLDRYQRIKEFYVGEGWFRDGEKGNFDYYNSWGFHYSLFWIDQIAPDFDPVFIRQSAVDFCRKFKYLFAPQGFAFFGRSIIYRFAAPCALISTMLQQQQADGQVKRIISTLFSFFLQRGAIKEGVFTQGLFGEDRRLLDPYSGSASAFWSLRSLVLLLYGATELGFWQIEEELLEVEKDNFSIQIPAINLHIQGYKESKEVVATFAYNQYPDAVFRQATLISQPFYYQWVEKIIGRSLRKKNNLLRKGVTTFSSKLNLYLK